MAEIRQIQVDGVNYDLVISEDEVSATRAEQAAQRATQQATYASNYAIQAGNAVTNAEEYAQDAQDAADRAEAIVGGQFVSYGHATSLTEAEKETARTNIGASPGNNPNLVKNGWFRINSKNKSTYSPGPGSTLDCWRFAGQNDTDTITVLADGIQVVGSGTTRVYQDYSSGFQAVETGKTYTLSVLVTELNGTCQAVWHAGEYFNLSVGLNTHTGVVTSEMKAVFPVINLNGTIKIKATKLEVGTVSTLMNNVASDDNLESIRCNYPMHSNPNLLDNAYFVGGGSQLGDGIFPINQRGQTSYTGGITGFDRWTVDGGDFTATLESGGVRVTSTTPYAGLSQIMPAYKLQNGETYTYSIIVDGVLHTATFEANSDGNWANIYYGDDWYVPYQFVNGKWTFKVINTLTSTGMNHLVSKVKLEKGTYSTLANDVPPNFGEELAKCKAYFQRVKQPQGYTAPIGFGIIGASSNILRTLIPLSSPLRDATSITASATNIGQMKVCGNGSYFTPSAITGRTVLNGHAVVDITVSGSLQNYMVYHIILHDASTYIDLSAEL